MKVTQLIDYMDFMKNVKEDTISNCGKDLLKVSIAYQ